jgi:hypothetical protein
MRSRHAACPILHVADVWPKLFWGDYVPEDCDTWSILNELSAGHTRVEK